MLYYQLIPTKGGYFFMGMALAELLNNDALEAMSFGMEVDKFKSIKQGYIETYKIVNDTFEKGFKMPKRRHGFKPTLKGLNY
jgi:hypothetical protein